MGLPLKILVAMVVLVVALFLTLRSVITFYNTYNESFHHLNEKIDPCKNLKTDFCDDPYKKDHYDLAEKCHDCQHKLNQDLSLQALESTLNQYGFCLGWNCGSLVVSMVTMDPFKAIGLVLFLVVLCILGAFFSVLQTAWSFTGLSLLPMTSSSSSSKYKKE